ncbi:hypothetical protein [Flavobacterium johnsoniae]|uniref:Uncharacterized protein n=1 Tax=Flavobacterium johnsoniae TaxID=986 RepID=A0A1M5IW15_FLAJO|nr:hypothetical protein [Flavobacterium johnsoniae]SHG32335.1 hypothetical protein SAMN05444388_102271 [Flavobacterium johnsoniae]
MKNKFQITRLLLTIAFTLFFSVVIFSQNKFHYLTVEFSNRYTDSINYEIISAGLNSMREKQIKPYITKTIKLKAENELLNALGEFGWEIYHIEDIANKITQIKNYYNGQPSGDYNFYRDGIVSKRKIYCKVKE